VRTLIRNLHYGVRVLRKNPGLTAAVIATLMLGIGPTTAIYTVVYAVLLAPLPYPDANQLVIVWSKVNGHNNGMSAGDFLDWKEQNKSFQHLSAWTGASFNLATNDQPEQIDGMRPTPGWFSMQLPRDPAGCSVPRCSGEWTRVLWSERRGRGLRTSPIAKIGYYGAQLHNNLPFVISV
jgi:hypothetical protein